MIEALAREPMDVEDRREIFEILAQGESIDDQGLNEALSGAVREGGKFVLAVLAAGELRFDFDELGDLEGDDGFRFSLHGGRRGFGQGDPGCANISWRFPISLVLPQWQTG